MLADLNERRHASTRKKHSVTDGTVRATRAARVAAVILTAVSCSVYDESLMGGGASQAGNGGTSSAAGYSGTAGDAIPGAGRAGSAGKVEDNGGSPAGEGGMMEAAGASEVGGDSSDGGSSGTSGVAGAGGSAAGGAGRDTGGSAGNVGGGGAGGRASGGGGGNGGNAGSVNGGAAGSAGSAGSPAVTGCAKLSVPMNDANDRAHFVISLPAAADFSSASSAISMHLYVQAGAAGTVFNYVQDSQYHYLGVATAARPGLGTLAGWQTLIFNVGTLPVGSSGIVKTDIRRIGIEINAAPDASGWSNPTVVFVDSIAVTAPTLSFPFDTSSTVSTTASSSDVAGQVLWQHSGTSDTTATGVTLAWQATCP